MIFKFDDSQALQQFNQYNRKDSGSSEVAAFLNPSGRTSRISSVGSQGSAVSRLSGASGISRSPSPHKMLVETSFCGPKPIEPSSDASSIEQLTADMLENVILARRGDPTKASLAEGVLIKDESFKTAPKSTKEKLQDIPPMTPAEAARAAAKESRKREIEALKARLNAINAKQLEKTKNVGTVTGPGVASGSGGGASLKKTVIGVTSEGTEYTRIKLKPDHLYDDKGMSPNERIIEESDFKESHGRREKSRKEPLADKSLNQISRISPTTHATDKDNRSPSPAASTSVSRKSSFCSFFKSKESGNETSSKPRSSSAASGKGRLNDKSPLPSPSKSSNISSRIASFSLFKTNRNMSPSQIESNDGMTLKPFTQQHQSRQPIKAGTPKLKYYDAPDVIHIPLHTPPEEKEFSALKKKKDVDEKVESKIPPAPPIRHEKVSTKPKVAPTAQIEKMQSTDEIELQELPNRKTSTVDDREGGSSLWSVEVQRHSSQESQETVISSQQKNEHASKNGITDKPAIPAYINTINENTEKQPMSATGRHKKHILFSTKIGSGSEEQVFCTQLSLSKTESQSSQLSEQASVFESPKNEESIVKISELSRTSLKQQSSSEIEKILCARSRRSDQSDSAESRPHSVTRKHQTSTELSKNRDSSDEALRKKRDSGEHKKIGSQSSVSPSMNSVHSQTSFQKQELPQASSLQHHSSGSKMEISSESDRESDIDGCVHKRVSRIMEDHESAGLVLQESFDDELPYVPTTLPEERSSGLRIVPTKDRTQSELITIPVERPRSTTPINPASLENYCERKPSDASETSLVRGEKLRISLPKQKAEQTKEKVQQKVITRRISNLSNKSWTEFAEQQQQPQPQAAARKVEKGRKQSNSSQDDDPPPPPPSKYHSKKSLTSKWIDFENIPEKRQAPKKITTIPSSKEPVSEKNHKQGHHHQRHYVSPEECQCECHESLTKKDTDSSKQSPADSGKTPSSDDSQPLLDDAERKSLMR